VRLVTLTRKRKPQRIDVCVRVQDYIIIIILLIIIIIIYYYY
jgi:hypothetical protein